MKKILVAILTISFVLSITISPIFADDKVTETGNRYNGDEYLEVNERVEGDLITINNEVVTNAPIEDNMISLGRKILVNENIQGDLFLGGGYIVVNGSVFGGDVRIVGAKVYINSEIIAGDLTIIADEVYISDQTRILGEEILNVRKEVRNADDNPTDLRDAEEEINKYMDTYVVAEKGFSGSTGVVGFIFAVVMFLASILVSYFILRFFPVFTEATLITIKKHYLKSIGIGFVLLALSVPIAIVLLISIVGIKLFAFLTLLFFISIMLTQTYFRYLVGRMLLVKMGRNESGRLLPLIVGTLLTTVFSQ
ncbi:MAG: hypothetical protein Q9M91_04825 [Candidatus Dojkabacteria bacterium]|nr:hypothetical protein [Candidatus Dojkabacteria bacterium]